MRVGVAKSLSCRSHKNTCQQISRIRCGDLLRASHATPHLLPLLVRLIPCIPCNNLLHGASPYHLNMRKIGILLRKSVFFYGNIYFFTKIGLFFDKMSFSTKIGLFFYENRLFSTEIGILLYGNRSFFTEIGRFLLK